MQDADVWVEIEFPMPPGVPSIKTNANREGVRELLETWLQSQVGQGADPRPPHNVDVNHITIGVRMSDDTFFTESNTGNDSLTCGMVMAVLSQLESLEV